LLADRLPFEYPKQVDAIRKLLAERGVDLQTFFFTIYRAIRANQSRDPLFIVLGSPMRGVSGEQASLQHLAVWYVPDEVTDALVASLERYRKKLQDSVLDDGAIN